MRHLSYSQSHLSASPCLSTNHTSPEFKVPSFLSCYCSPCTAPPLLFPDPLPIPPTMLPSPSMLPLLLSLPSSFPPPTPPSLLLLWHFLPLLRVTPHELFTHATQWGILLRFPTVYCTKIDRRCFLKGKNLCFYFKCAGEHKAQRSSLSGQLLGALAWKTRNTQTQKAREVSFDCSI